MDQRRYTFCDAAGLMEKFAELTGLGGSENPTDRYLWTDAFAVCNYLGLYRRTDEKRYLDLALELVSQVHLILGKHRKDDERKGWISGLGPEEGAKHPTAGGLRIGKEFNERKPGEPYDDELEWNRDGQYYHYLTKWMHALNQMGNLTGDSTYVRWAVELAASVHKRFVYATGNGGKRMYWKMNIGLTHPLVTSMGHHDPLDGLITYLELESSARNFPSEDFPDLDRQIHDMEEICSGVDWTTHDPLGLGGLLADIYLLAQLTVSVDRNFDQLMVQLIDDAGKGLRLYTKSNALGGPANYRLAFRELGLAIGLKALPEMMDLIGESGGAEGLESDAARVIRSMEVHFNLAAEIVNFWCEPGNQEAASWKSHRNINMVMLATSIAPEGFLRIRR